MFAWLREFMEIRYEAKVAKLRLEQEAGHNRCESCEVLKVELQRANIEKEKLLNKILEKPTDPPVEPISNITPPRQIPWMVRRQMLEAEDREKARLMRESIKPDTTPRFENDDVKDLEKELGIKDGERDITQERTAASSGVNRT